MIEMTGKTFGRLTVIRRSGTQCGQALWECLCSCGNIKNVLGQNLRRGFQISCGCYEYERKTLHGATKNDLETGEYRAWKAMKSRCYRKSSATYSEYGGRGIRVCDRWIHNFENFIEDMGHKPSPKHSVDRIDVNGDYDPNNCRWATSSEQMINQRIRRDNSSGCKGVSWDKKKSKWHAYISPGDSKKRINIGYFIDLQDAIDARKQAELIYRD